MVQGLFHIYLYNKLRNEGISDSKYLEDVLNPLRSLKNFDDELTKFTQKQNKKVTFSDFSFGNSSFLFKKMPLSENVVNFFFYNSSIFFLEKVLSSQKHFLA